MIAFLIVILLLIFYSVRLRFYSIDSEFLSKKRTDAIKGVFIIVVFVNHIKNYYEQVGANISAWYDNLFFLPAKVLGQLMVVMFLFYSGYGVMEGIKNKGQEYVNAIPKKRVLNTLVNFDVAVVVFTVTMLIIGMPFTLNQFVLSLVGWESMGNSNWYIFVIILCYSMTYLGYKINTAMGGAITCVLVLLLAYILSVFQGTWWYNTIFAYSAGLIFSKYKESIVPSMKENYYRWMIAVGSGLMSCLGTYLYFYTPFKGEYERLGALVFDVMSVFFAFMVVLLTMKIQIENKVLVWLGSNLFPLYIYQRLSMMILTELYPHFMVVQHPYIFLLICMTITCVIGWGYKWINIKIA